MSYLVIKRPKCRVVSHLALQSNLLFFFFLFVLPAFILACFLINKKSAACVSRILAIIVVSTSLAGHFHRAPAVTSLDRVVTSLDRAAVSLFRLKTPVGATLRKSEGNPRRHIQTMCILRYVYFQWCYYFYVVA